MSRHDLFRMALENAASLADACSAHSSGLREFAIYVERESRLSVTMKLQRLQTFLDGGKYLNPWEECHRDAKGNVAHAEQLMRERQGSWYNRRAMFDGSFVDGKKFRYGTLYLSGRSLVTAKYGPFSAVFRLDAAAAWSQIAWLPQNSLERYVPSDVDFNIDRLRREVGPHASRHHVAALKHEKDVESWRREEWGTRLCHHDETENKDVFVEGIVAENLLVKHIERILVHHEFWRVLEDAYDAIIDAESGLGGDTVTDVQKADATCFEAIRRALRDTGLMLEIP